MANQVKQYFLAPSWDYPPNGPIALGNIILSPSRPVPPLFNAATMAAKTTTIHNKTQPVFSTTKHQVEWTRDRASTHAFGVWAKFVESLGVSLGFETARAERDVFRFDRIRTDECFPEESYLAAALANGTVQRQLELAGRRRGGRRFGRGGGSGGGDGVAVYVIVGVKTVSGARVKRMRAGVVRVQAEVAVDPALVGAPAPVPVTVGPMVGIGREKGENMSFEGSDDFVFAYRVQKVWLRGGHGGVVRCEDYNKGAMLGLEDDGNESKGFSKGIDPGDVILRELTSEDVNETWHVGRVAENGDEGEVEVLHPHRIE
ncbi:hypothetical protein VTH82DRAFT_6074 [Thermothelomyces myriococcoides]